MVGRATGRFTVLQRDTIVMVGETTSPTADYGDSWGGFTQSVAQSTKGPSDGVERNKKKKQEWLRSGRTCVKHGRVEVGTAPEEY